MVDYVPNEKATPIRMPSTANLMIASEDRDNPLGSPWELTITRTSNLQNGFFTRVGTTEVILDWKEPNIITDVNDEFSVDISGTTTNTYAGTQTVNLSQGLYTVAQVLDSLVLLLNATTGTTGATFSVGQSVNKVSLDCSGAVFRLNPTPASIPLMLELGFNTADTTLSAKKFILGAPDIRPYPYIDFTSEQLTYAQDVKDAATNTYNRNVLCRWYFDEDVPETVDTYGFPIFMGYRPFCRRRVFNPPKQIRWDNNLPLGNLSFTVYTNGGTVVEDDNPIPLAKSSWRMTLQLSEI